MRPGAVAVRSHSLFTKLGVYRLRVAVISLKATKVMHLIEAKLRTTCELPSNSILSMVELR
jgi:hypothetical protein